MKLFNKIGLLAIGAVMSIGLAVGATQETETGVVKADTSTITIKYDDKFTPALPTASGSVNTVNTTHTDTTAGITIGERGIYKGSSSKYFMFAQNKGFMYNTVALSQDIISIDVTYSSGTSTSAKIGVYFGTTAIESRQTTGHKTIAGTSKTDTFEPDSTGCKFFNISTSYKNTQITTIVITIGVEAAKTFDELEVRGTPDVDTYYLGQPFNPSGLTVMALFNGGTIEEDVTTEISWGEINSDGTVVGTWEENGTVTISGLTVYDYPTNVQVVEFDFKTTANLSSIVGDDLTYYVNPITILFDGNGQQSHTGTYYGGDASNRTSTRVYNKNIVTITSTANYPLGNITIKFTSSDYASVFARMQSVDYTMIQSSTTVTIYPVVGCTEIVLNPTGTSGFTSINFDVFGDPIGVINVESVSLDVEDLELTVGETYELTATVLPAEANDKSVTWSSNNEEVATVVDGVVTAVGTGTANITVTTTDGGYTDSVEVTVIDYAPTHHKVTSEEDLYNGAQVIIGATTSNVVATRYETGNNVKPVDAIYAADRSSVQVDENAQEFTIWKIGDYWTFFDGTTYLYAAGSTNNNYLKGTKDITTETAGFTLTYSEGVLTAVATMEANEENRNALYYNNGNSIFSCYKAGSKYEAPVLYVKDQTAFDDEQTAETFMNVYLKMDDASFEGDGTGLCKKDNYYDNAKVVFATLLDAQKEIVVNNSEALLRLIKWAEANDETFDPETFSFASNNRFNILQINSDNSNLIIVILTIAALSFLAIAIIVKSKKQYSK